MAGRRKEVVPFEGPVISEAQLLPVCKVAGCAVVGRVGEVMCDGHNAEQRRASTHRALAEATPAAADVLIDLMTNGQSEEVRRRSATDVLDRAGIRPGLEIALAPASGDTPGPGDVL